MRNILIIQMLILLSQFKLVGQDFYFQDIWQGGITGAGANVGGGTIEATYQFDVFIEPNSTIKKAFLFSGTYSSIGEITVLLNSVPLSLNQSSVVTSDFIGYETQSGFSQVHALDITQHIESLTTQYNLFVPAQNLENGQRFRSFYIVIIYENASLSTQSACIVLNNADVSANTFYNFAQINPVNNLNPVGFAFLGHAFCNTDFDGSYIFVENTNIGLVGGNDFNAQFFCSGTQGHFYYQNSELFGLGDDLPDESMEDSDAIANIQNLLNLNTTTLEVNFVHQSSVPVYSISNPITAAFLAYTSPCQPFLHSLLTSDTTTCANAPLQLGASGGIAYNWLPETNLSCYDCPNPVFLGDSTINYTVRIWSTDSCSVVQPVRVRVLPQPTLEVVNNTPATCGFSNGSLTALASGTTPTNTYTYTLSGGTQGLPGNFTNLAPGTYTLSATDANGCTSDTTVQILEINNVQAAFSVNPSTGAAPLQVQTQNNSQNATLYDWFWANENSTLENPNITLDTAGIYTLTLVASNGAAHCNDTTTLQIVVYDSLQIVIPNVFTPNNDGVNDFFGITSNVGVTGSVVILNRWGNIVLEKEFTTTAGGFEPLWDGTSTSSQPVNDGFYFYKISIDNKGLEFLGNVSLWR